MNERIDRNNQNGNLDDLRAGSGAVLSGGGQDAAGGIQRGQGAHNGAAEPVSGLFSGVSNADYHGGKGISSTSLKDVLKCPALYQAKKIGQVKQEETEALLFGSAYHCYVLERDVFFDEYVVRPNSLKKPTAAQLNAKKRSESSQQNIDEWNAFAQIAQGKTIIKMADFNKIKDMCDVLMAHPFIQDYGLFNKEHGKAEQSGYYTDGATGLLCKYRPDWRGAGFICDLKTISSATDTKIKYQSRDLKYHVSAAHYIEGEEALERAGLIEKAAGEFNYVFQEKEPPYLVSVKVLHPDTLDKGREERREALNLIKECENSGLWPMYNSNTSTYLEF